MQQYNGGTIKQPFSWLWAMRLRGEGEYIKVVNTWVTFKELEKENSWLRP
jgi:hypothetical protein